MKDRKRDRLWRLVARTPAKPRLPGYAELTRFVQGYLDSPAHLRTHHLAWALTRRGSPYVLAIGRAGGVRAAFKIVLGDDWQPDQEVSARFATPECLKPGLDEIVGSIVPLLGLLQIDHPALHLDRVSPFWADGVPTPEDVVPPAPIAPRPPRSGLLFRAEWMLGKEGFGPEGEAITAFHTDLYAVKITDVTMVLTYGQLPVGSFSRAPKEVAPHTDFLVRLIHPIPFEFESYDSGNPPRVTVEVFGEELLS